MIIVCLLGLLVLCVFSKAALAGAGDGLSLFASVVLPSLLPYLVITGMLQRMGAEALLGKPFGWFARKLFRCGQGSVGTFLLASLSGYPVGARLIGRGYSSGKLIAGEATRMAAFCLNSGPSFVVVSLGVGMFGDIAMGWKIYAAHILGALMNGMIFSRMGEMSGERESLSLQSEGGMNAFFGSIDSAAKSLLAVGVTIAFFSSLVAILEQSGAMALLNKGFMALGLPETLCGALSAGLMEMTSGCKRAVLSAEPAAWRAALCAFLISLGGLSVMMQSLYFLKGALKKRVFFLQRVTHALISLALAYVFAIV